MTENNDAVSNTPEATMRRIQALLEMAAHPSTPPHERDLSQERADRLMAQYRLNRAMLNFDKDADDKGKPESQEYDHISLIDETVKMSSRDYREEFGIEWSVNDLRALVYGHAGCRTATSHKKTTIVGFSEDIFFGNMLWGTIFQDLVTKMFPRWSGSGSDTFDKNVFLLKNAGYSWPQVREAGLAMEAKDRTGKLTAANAGSKLRTAYARECKRVGYIAPAIQPRSPGLWRRSFIDSFKIRLSERFMQMRINARTEEQAAGKSGELALFREKDQINDLFYELFPHLHPDNLPKPTGKAIKLKDRAADPGAWQAGYSAANQVNISNAKAAGDKKAEVES